MRSIDQVAVKPAVIFKTAPGYCLKSCRGTNYIAWESVELFYVHFVGGQHGGLFAN